jgi:transposase
MPWKASSMMEERLRFVARPLDAEAMTEVCRDFGISRKTGYKIFDRYKQAAKQQTDARRKPYGYLNGSRATSVACARSGELSPRPFDSLHVRHVLEPCLAAEFNILLSPQSIRQPARRQYDVIIRNHRVLGDTSLQPAALHQAFRQISTGTHLVCVHRLPICHVHAIVVEQLTSPEILLGDGADFDDGTVERLGRRVAKQHSPRNRVGCLKMH